MFDYIFIVYAIAMIILIFMVFRFRKNNESMYSKNLDQINESIEISKKSLENSTKSVELLSQILTELKKKP